MGGGDFGIIGGMKPIATNIADFGTLRRAGQIYASTSKKETVRMRPL